MFVQGAGQCRLLFPFALWCFGGWKAAQISWQSLTHLHLLLVLFDSSPKSQSEAAEQGGRAQQCDAGARHKLNHPVIIIRVGVHHSWGVRTPPWPVSLSAGVLCSPNRCTQNAAISPQERCNIDLTHFLSFLQFQLDHRSLLTCARTNKYVNNYNTFSCSVTRKLDDY